MAQRSRPFRRRHLSLRCDKALMYASVDIFAGAGGLALGAHDAGFSIKLLLDSSPIVCDTLRHNRVLNGVEEGAGEVVEADIQSFDFSRFAEVDILLGGPPCQPFSVGGRRRRHADKRNMFPQAVRALQQISPKSFLFENVKGLATGESRNYLELIRLQLQFPAIASDLFDLTWEEQLARLEDVAASHAGNEAQYNIVIHVLNAADYGVPQKRERIFFAGFRRDLGIEWHFPKPTHSRQALNFAQSRKGEYWERHKVPLSKRSYTDEPSDADEQLTTLPWQTTRDALLGLPDPMHSSEVDPWPLQHTFVPGAREYRGHTGSILDLPSKTLKAGVNGVPGGENMLRCEDGSVRYFTIRECARLQTFPDRFEFLGPRSEQMRQLGNAVPCTLAAKILTSMREAIEGSCMKGDHFNGGNCDGSQHRY